MKVCSHDYNIRCKRTAPQWKQLKTQTVIVSKQSELQFIGDTAVTALCDVSCPYQLGSSLCAQLSRARERGTDLDDSELFLLPVAVEKSLPARSKSALRPCLGLTREAQTSGPRLLCAFLPIAGTRHGGTSAKVGWKPKRRDQLTTRLVWRSEKQKLYWIL